MVEPAFAGHAGEAGAPMVFPHEVMGAVVLLAVIGTVLIVLAGIGIWLLLRIDRRLKPRGPASDDHRQNPTTPSQP